MIESISSVDDWIMEIAAALVDNGKEADEKAIGQIAAQITSRILQAVENRKRQVSQKWRHSN